MVLQSYPSHEEGIIEEVTQSQQPNVHDQKTKELPFEGAGLFEQYALADIVTVLLPPLSPRHSPCMRTHTHTKERERIL